MGSLSVTSKLKKNCGMNRFFAIRLVYYFLSIPGDISRFVTGEAGVKIEQRRLNLSGIGSIWLDTSDS
jgi:hypothetical protein